MLEYMIKKYNLTLQNCSYCVAIGSNGCPIPKNFIDINWPGAIEVHCFIYYALFLIYRSIKSLISFVIAYFSLNTGNLL